jgi:hypothetical protein
MLNFRVDGFDDLLALTKAGIEVTTNPDWAPAIRSVLDAVENGPRR